MTTTYPALRGKFGATTYYVVTMRVSELVDRILFPADMPEWGNLSIEEQFQRKLDTRRIQRHMMPYFATDERRFSGSLVVAVQDMTGKEFEGIHDITAKPLPAAYGAAADDLGFLTLDCQKLIPLDGQHRAKAFQLALKEGNSELADDGISVIIMGFEKSLSRHIFNKINKYARPTSKAGKLITDDDDAMAVITRGLITKGIIPKRLVNLESNSLNKSSHHFTLISTLYDANKSLLSVLPVKVVGRPEDMDRKERERNQKEIAGEWTRLISGISEWGKALDNPDKKGDKYRTSMRQRSILGRPIGQLALVRGYVYACGNTEHADKDAIVGKLDKIDWRIKNKMWEGLLVRPNGRMMYGSRVATTASKMIAHLVGVRLSKSMEDQLLDYIHGTARPPGKRLPKPVD